MNIHIPSEFVNKHRLLTKNEIDSYYLAPHMDGNETPSDYTDTIRDDEILGYPCFIDTNADIENAKELNEKYVFRVKGPSKTRVPYMYSLFIQYQPEHGVRGGKSKKRKTKKSKKIKKNKTNKK